MKVFRNDWKWLNGRICRRFKLLKVKEKCITTCVFQTDEGKDSVILSFKMFSNWGWVVPKTDVGNIFWTYLYKLIFPHIWKTGIIGIISEVFWVLCLTRVLITATCLFYEFLCNQIRNSWNILKIISFGSRFNHYLLFILVSKIRIQRGEKKGFDRDTPPGCTWCLGKSRWNAFLLAPREYRASSTLLHIEKLKFGICALGKWKTL